MIANPTSTSTVIHKNDDTVLVQGLISRRVRKRVEGMLGWMKSVGGFRRTRFRGLKRTQLAGYFVGAASNLLGIARLVAA